jgi:four helix bundle protein
LIAQVVGSAGSIGANYREANDSLGKKDFLQKMKIAQRGKRIFTLVRVNFNCK